MGQRYNIHFKNYRNTAYDVKVYINGYVGQVTELLGARSAFVVEGNDENFVYEPIRSSTALRRRKRPLTSLERGTCALSFP